MSPLNAMLAGDSSKGYGFTRLSGGSGFFGYMTTSPAKLEYARGMTVDGSNNLIFGGIANNGTINTFFGASLNSTASTINWQKLLNTSAVATYRSLISDSSNNIYMVGNVNASGNPSGMYVKYNSSGVVQFQKQINYGSGTWNNPFYSVNLDSAGTSLYMTGYHDNNGGSDGMGIWKWDTSGTVTWQRRLADGSGASGVYGFGSCLDSSNNVYVCGYNSAGTQSVVIAKYNSSGTLQWQRTLSNTDYEEAYGIATNSTDVYVCGRVGATGFLAKYNTSGTIQWQRFFAAASNVYFNSVALDASGNIYVGGRANSQVMLLAKYNSSGTLQWQRTISITSSTNDEITNIFVKGDQLYFTALTNASGTTDLAYGNVPIDGSKTGTYSVGTLTWTYAAGSGTDSAGTFTDAAGSFTSSTPTASVTAPTYTETSYTATNNVKAL